MDPEGSSDVESKQRSPSRTSHRSKSKSPSPDAESREDSPDKASPRESRPKSPISPPQRSPPRKDYNRGRRRSPPRRRPPPRQRKPEYRTGERRSRSGERRSRSRDRRSRSLENRNRRGGRARSPPPRRRSRSGERNRGYGQDRRPTRDQHSRRPSGKAKLHVTWDRGVKIDEWALKKLMASLGELVEDGRVIVHRGISFFEYKYMEDAEKYFFVKNYRVLDYLNNQRYEFKGVPVTLRLSWSRDSKRFRENLDKGSNSREKSPEFRRLGEDRRKY